MIDDTFGKLHQLGLLILDYLLERLLLALRMGNPWIVMIKNKVVDFQFDFRHFVFPLARGTFITSQPSV